jgi:hypothetical protein
MTCSRRASPISGAAQVRRADRPRGLIHEAPPPCSPPGWQTGSTLVAVLIAVLALDEWLAPWFPLWLATAAVVMLRCGLGAGRPARARPRSGRRPPLWAAGLAAMRGLELGPHVVEWSGRAANPRCRRATPPASASR